MGDDMPTGISRVIWNVLMSLSVLLTAALSFWCLWSRAGYLGLTLFVGFGVLGAGVHFMRGKKGKA